MLPHRAWFLTISFVILTAETGLGITPAPIVAPVPQGRVHSTSAHVESTRLVQVEGSYDFGVGIVGQVVSHDFNFVNKSQKNEAIESVTSSCSCTTVLSFTKAISAGSSGTIAIQTKLDLPGSKSITLAVKRADGTITIFVVTGKIAAQMEPVLQAYNPSNYAEPKDIMGDRSVTLLDLRSSQSFDLAHVPKSLNIPVNDLASRAYLAKKSLILLGTGADDESLLPVVEECKRAGFVSIRILRGGIRLWQQSGGSLQGLMWNRPPLDHVSLGDLVNSAVRSPWILLVRTDNSHVLDSVPALCKVETFKTSAELTERLGQKPIRPDTKFGVFSESILDCSKIGNPVFIISEPFWDYPNLVRSLTLASQPPSFSSNTPPNWDKRIRACATCP